MEVVDFIKRRFNVDSHFLDMNCYYFAVILKSRFSSGSIYYDVINGHFVFLYESSFYDWSGQCYPDGYLVEWDSFENYDPIQKEIIIRDCIK